MNNKQVKKGIINILIIIGILTLIFLIYGMGQMHGIIVGLSLDTQGYNETICDIIKKYNNSYYRDNEGYCVLKHHKYDIKLECSYEKFRIRGNKSLPLHIKIAHLPQKIILYPILRCW